jgi:hypothetical protein
MTGVNALDPFLKYPSPLVGTPEEPQVARFVAAGDVVGLWRRALYMASELDSVSNSLLDDYEEYPDRRFVKSSNRYLGQRDPDTGYNVIWYSEALLDIPPRDIPEKRIFDPELSDYFRLGKLVLDILARGSCEPKAKPGTIARIAFQNNGSRPSSARLYHPLKQWQEHDLVYETDYGETHEVQLVPVNYISDTSVIRALSAAMRIVLPSSPENNALSKL